jgi:hypothetical protein
MAKTHTYNYIVYNTLILTWRNERYEQASDLGDFLARHNIHHKYDPKINGFYIKDNGPFLMLLKISMPHIQTLPNTKGNIGRIKDELIYQKG